MVQHRTHARGTCDSYEVLGQDRLDKVLDRFGLGSNNMDRSSRRDSFSRHY